jgi:ATP-binding cassette subfamily F protein 3
MPALNLAPEPYVEDATWHIQPNERIGLIGYNGTGSNQLLLKVLTGQYLPKQGHR